ncbi:hypothetical protein BGV68_01935 [Burkholderia ubonensis]|uniref:hypothetical protein n=1 Tax=Burkholderia ubonensis TaxID=101571 RepID=UPI0008FDDA08|nr:hypothetical protein [Burkholderia ubonensis]OJA63805.1 hypothetical protein BGV68_01935 [Burkholderia ubonensis]
MEKEHAFLMGAALALAAVWLAHRLRGGTSTPLLRTRSGAQLQTGMYVPPYDTENVTLLP